MGRLQGDGQACYERFLRTALAEALTLTALYQFLAAARQAAASDQQ